MFPTRSKSLLSLPTASIPSSKTNLNRNLYPLVVDLDDAKVSYTIADLDNLFKSKSTDISSFHVVHTQHQHEPFDAVEETKTESSTLISIDDSHSSLTCSVSKYDSSFEEREDSLDESSVLSPDPRTTLQDTPHRSFVEIVLPKVLPTFEDLYILTRKVR